MTAVTSPASELIKRNVAAGAATLKAWLFSFESGSLPAIHRRQGQVRRRHGSKDAGHDQCRLHTVVWETEGPT